MKLEVCIEQMHILKNIFLIEVKFSNHKIKHFKVNNSVAFSMFTMLWTTTSIYFQNIFITPK